MSKCRLPPLGALLIHLVSAIVFTACGGDEVKSCVNCYTARLGGGCSCYEDVEEDEPCEGGDVSSEVLGGTCSDLGYPVHCREGYGWKASASECQRGAF